MDEENLACLVGQCYETLNIYGREPGQLKTITRTFLMLLGEYPIVRVRAAFIAWLKSNSEFPTPAGIISLIEGDDEEWGYIFGCLDHVKRGGSIADWAIPRIEKKLGKNWKDYV